MAQSQTLTEKLKSCIGQARHLKLKSGKIIPAGIRSVNEIDSTVKYLYGEALSRLKKLQEQNLPTQEFFKTESNYSIISISEIDEVVEHR